MHNRRPDNLPQIQHFTKISLGFLLIVTSLCGIFVYLVSPLRDPAFQRNSANGGSLVPWLSGWSDKNWLIGAAILAAMLATNLTLLAIVHLLEHRPLKNSLQRRIRLKPIIPGIIVWSIAWIFLFFGLQYVFLIYLLSQWLVD